MALMVACSCMLGQLVEQLQVQRGEGVWGGPMPALGGGSHRSALYFILIYRLGPYLEWLWVWVLPKGCCCAGAVHG